MKRAFEDDLSLEYKLSNIAQAKGFAAQLESIGCFYTDRPVDYAPVTDFGALIKEPGHEDNLTKIAIAEHERWCIEKKAMGWGYGTAHVGAVTTGDGKKKNDSAMRERTRLHHDLIEYSKLEAEERFKDSDPMEQMVELIRERWADNIPYAIMPRLCTNYERGLYRWRFLTSLRRKRL